MSGEVGKGEVGPMGGHGGAGSGEPAGRKARATLRVLRPADGSLVGEARVASRREVLEAVERARRAQRAWVERPAEERFAILSRLPEELGRRADEITSVVMDETGKPELEALVEVLLGVDLLRHYLEIAPRVLRRQWVKTGWLVGKSAYTYREPYGVVGAVTPWNYPFLLAMDAVSTALFAGNGVVLKPSELTPFSGLAVGRMCRGAGVPGDLVQVVVGDGATGEALVRADVDKVLFTGSSRTGRKVMAAAAEGLTPVTLELGGKDPAIVLEDADLERAAQGILYGAFFNAGQTCISTERVFVREEVHDELVERLVAGAEKLRVGTEGDVDVGPMISSEQIEIVEDQVADALSRGARAVTGGERLAEGSPCYRPTVLVDVDRTMKVLWEETFGPVLPVMAVEEDDDAVRLVNSSPYGLFASVWTEDRERGERLGERLRAGGVSINDTLSHFAVPALPMGGAGESGFGRRRGAAGLEELTRVRSVLVHRAGLTPEIWWYPYSGRAYRLVRALLEYRQASGPGRIWNGLRRLVSGGRRRT
ncbi:MAG: aldehyde dehydrogenase family protein [Gemmatimonadota bacterium]|jgi:succinate-semialdehyde dehydrogenase/glutarate-semialdehyde dehydrogenase